MAKEKEATHLFTGEGKIILAAIARPLKAKKDDWLWGDTGRELVTFIR